MEQPKRHDLVFYGNRSTPQVVHSGTEPKAKNGYGDVSSRRPASQNEEDWMKKTNYSKWLRVDEAGNTPRQPEYKKTQYRPWLVPVSKSAFGVEHVSKGFFSGASKAVPKLPNSAKSLPKLPTNVKFKKPKTPLGSVGPEDMLKPGSKLPEGNANHAIAGQQAQEAGDHASAAWASKQQLRQAAGKAVNRLNGH